MIAPRACRVDVMRDGSDGVSSGLGAPGSADARARASHAGRHIILPGSGSAFDTQSRPLDPDGLIQSERFERRALADRAPDHIGPAAAPERFALARRLGGGSMGVVYEAHDRATGSRIADHAGVARTAIARREPRAPAPSARRTRRDRAGDDGA